MAFTGRLGSSQSKLGNIALGVGEAGAEGFSFTARALLLKVTEVTFTADAVLERRFTADAVLLKINSVTFTANARIAGTSDGTCFDDDFNRAGPTLGTDWDSFGGTEAEITANELVVEPEESEFIVLDTGFAPLMSEGQMDFYVPPVTDDGYHGYELGISGRSFYIDNWIASNTPSTTWQLYMPSGSTIYQFVPDADTWYTIKARGRNKAGLQFAKLWKRGDTEPTAWTHIDLTTGTASDPQPWIYLDAISGGAVADSIYESKIDNYSICELFLVGSDAFTADAVMNPGATFTANAILKKTVSYPAHPTVRAQTSFASTTGNTKTVTMPTTGENDLVLAFVTVDSFGGVGGSVSTITPPAGWTLVVDEVSYSDDDQLSVLAAVYEHRVGTTAEPASYQWTTSRTRASYRIVSIQNAGNVAQAFANGIVNDLTEQTGWTLPELTAQYNHSLILGGWHGDNIMSESDLPVDPTGWAEVGTVVATTNAWIKVYSYANPDKDDVYEPTLNWLTDFLYGPAGTIIEIQPLGGVIYADAVIDADTLTFTADAVLQKPIHPFTADAIIKKVWSKPIVADAYIIQYRMVFTFTANAVLKVNQTEDKFFTANAVFHRDHTVAPGLPRLRRATTLTILQRREKPLDPYLPPRIPEAKEEGDDEQGPYCLPPCVGFGAGGDMNGWGSIKISITKCDFCNNYWRSDSEFLGSGSGLIESSEHCGYCGAHDRDEHTTRLWVNYPDIPDRKFLLRAKLTWDQNGPDKISVIVKSVSTFPTIDVDGCEDSPDWDDQWNDGEELGRLDFVNDAEIGGYVLIGNVQYKYQDKPSELEVEGSNLSSNVLMFGLSDEDTHLNAKFRASAMDWPEI